jgi:5-formyltetrahydrofolate cyclo-ligase
MDRDEPFENAEDALRFRAKRELRKRMRSLRAALPPSAIAERSKRIVENLLALETWDPAGTVALFMSLPDEVQLDALIARAREQGKRVVLPVVTDAPALTFRAPFEHGASHSFVTSAYGIREPGEDAPVVAPDAIDLMIVPALAIDPRGHRIGYGAGYYDHTLALATAAQIIGVAFDFQLIAEVPERPADVRVHWIVTDRRVLRAER